MTEKVKAIRCGKLVDGTGDLPVENGVVVIEADRIKAIGNASKVEIPPDAEIIDATGNTVMPGLIDAHLHFLGISSPNQATWVIDSPHVRGMRSVMDAWRVIDSGFTSVRDAGGMLAVFLKNAIAERSIVGPRIVAAGKAISQTAGHADWHFVPEQWGERMMLGRIADGPSEVRKAAREQLREGADFLKIMTTGGVMSEKDKPTACQYSTDEIRAFVEEARNAGVKTGSHAQGAQGIKNAVAAGIDNIEHGIFLDGECIDMMLEKGTTLVATFAILDAIVTRGRELGVMEVSVKKGESVQAAHLENFKKAYRAGVKCGLGSDYLSGPMSPHGHSARELGIYVNKAGLTPMEAIVCATKNNAEILDLQDEIGTLEAGKQADLIIVQGDPLEDIGILQDRNNIISVLKGGEAVPRLPVRARGDEG
jgi:imidazolonepropionase-like amidohydrolase